MALGETPFGEIRIGLTMALVRRDLNDSLGPSALAAGIALLIAVLTSMLLAQLVLRPMHVIRSSLSRLGRGDLGATLDLRDDAEFRELGDVFDQVSAQLRAASPAGIKPAQLAELSRRIAMVGRLTAGVAHEMKNPLNAMTIHLELLKQKLAAGKSASQHVEVIGQEIRRLDERIQGFLKFVRPDEAKFGSGGDRAAPLERARRGPSRGATRRRVDHPRLRRRRVARRRRCRAAARRVSQPRAERDPGDAEGRAARHQLRRASKPARPRARRRYRGRHRAREPDEDFRVVLHHQGTRAPGSACRWCIGRSRSTTARSTSNRRSEWGRRLSSYYLRRQPRMMPMRLVAIVLLTASLGACAAKAQVQDGGAAAVARSAAAAAACRRDLYAGA